MTLTYEKVQQAYERTHPFLPITPLVQSFYLGDDDQHSFFKLESLQHAKRFKIRGALNKMLTLTEEEMSKSVVTISS